ncbi:hypothetical protein A5757_16390 [Mycobacterium sp. 852013-51886_SCH5428379]|nr:hypothetical protein A5757_16390 [Mycobacterium sp. 852013-51886_SCH5428379]
MDAAAAVASRLAVIPPDSAPTQRWGPVSLAEGGSGIALTLDYLAATGGDPAWVGAGRALFRTAAHAAQAGSAPNLFDGLAGIGFVAATTDGGAAYRRLLASVDRTLLDWLRADDTAGRDEFDVVSGLAGVGAYFLRRLDEPSGWGGLTAVVDRLLAGATVAGTAVRWPTPPDRVIGPLSDVFPDGCVNCGMAHGVPAPLALLALAWRHGIQGDRMWCAIEGAAEWLLAARTDDQWGPNWPAAVALPGGRGPTDPDRPTRAGWCYGTPGVSRALWLAGAALGRDDWCDTALESMAAVYRRPAEVRQTCSPGLCHGASGLLHITARFFADTGDDLFRRNAVALAEELLSTFDPQTAYGFQNFDRGVDFDNPGFLDGAAGAALALAAAASSAPPRWDGALLIA